MLVNLDVVGIYDSEQELLDSRIETLTMVMPELFHPHTKSKTQMTDKVTAVLLRRVFARRMNIG